MPARSFCQVAWNVSEVAALGRQVRDGASSRRSSGAYCTWVSLSRPKAMTRYSHWPSSLAGPVRSARISRRLWLPSTTPISRCASSSGRLLTRLTMPPVLPCPYSMEEGPRSTSTRSIAYTSVRGLLKLKYWRSPSRYWTGSTPRMRT
ncbi:hypothetical protein D9M69_575600 [compost metagenome]